MGRPGVVALVALKLKKAFLESLDNEEVFVIPLLRVLSEESCEGLLVRPLDANPLEALVLAELSCHQLVLDRQFAIHVVLDLLNGRVSLMISLSQWNLEPIGDFEDVSVLKVFIVLVLLIVRRIRLRLLLNRLELFPLEDLIVRQNLHIFLLIHFVK